MNPKPHAWKTAQETGPAAAPSSREGVRRKRLYAVVAGMLALTAAIVALALLFQADKEPSFLSIPITEYRERFYPVNAFAEQDSDALAAVLLGRSGTDGRTKGKAYESQDKALLVQQLARLRSNKDSRLVVHLSALARTQNDEVFLLPADAHPDKPDTWLPLAEVIQAMRDCPARDKLLILDIAGPVASARLGIVLDDVGTVLHDTLGKLTTENSLPFWVLCGCSRGEVCLSWEEKQQSAFGYFLGAGLRGHADGAFPKGSRPDGHVKVRELAGYVTEQVDQWAMRNRNQHQTPALFGNGSDFSLSTVPHGQPQPDPALEPAVYPDWLLDGWKYRDDCWAASRYHAAPRAYLQLEAALMRAEHRWRGGLGNDPERTRKALEGDRQNVQGQLDATGLSLPAAQSLVVESKRGKLPDPKVGEDVKSLVKLRLSQPENAKPDDIEKVVGKPRQELLDKLKGKPHYDLAAAAWAEALADEAPTLDKIKFLDDLLQRHAAEPRYVETLFLRRLVDMANQTGKWPDTVIARAMRTLREAETARTVPPSLLPLVESRLKQLTEDRLKAEALLLKGSPPSGMREAGRLFEDGETSFRQVNAFISLADEAEQLAEEATILLPGFVPYLLASQMDSRLDEAWISAAGAAQAIRDQIAEHPVAWPPADALLENNLLELRRCLDLLKTDFRGEPLQRLLKPDSKAGVNEYLQIQAVLESPYLAAGDRAALWQSGNTLGQNMQPESAAARPTLAERAFRRTVLAAKMLRQGNEDPGTLPAGTTGITSATWHAIGDKLRLGFAKGLPGRYAQTNDLAVRDRIARLVYPFEEIGKENCTGVLVRQQERAYWTWLAEQYAQEAKEPPLPVAARFYANFVTECRRMASQ